MPITPEGNPYDPNPLGLPPEESVTATGEFKFNAPGPIQMANKAAEEERLAAEELAAEVGMGPGTYKTRVEMIPHPWSGDLRALPMGDNLPPLNLPEPVTHFIMAHLDRQGWRKHDELALDVYQDPDGDQISINPGTWFPKADLPKVEVARRMAAAAPEEPLEFTDVSEERLKAMEAAIRAERIRKLNIQHMDLHAQVAEGFTSMPEETRPVIRKTPEAPRPQPNPDGSSVMPPGFAGNVGPQ